MLLMQFLLEQIQATHVFGVYYGLCIFTRSLVRGLNMNLPRGN